MRMVHHMITFLQQLRGWAVSRGRLWPAVACRCPSCDVGWGLLIFLQQLRSCPSFAVAGVCSPYVVAQEFGCCSEGDLQSHVAVRTRAV